MLTPYGFVIMNILYRTIVFGQYYVRKKTYASAFDFMFEFTQMEIIIKMIKESLVDMVKQGICMVYITQAIPIQA